MEIFPKSKIYRIEKKANFAVGKQGIVGRNRNVLLHCKAFINSNHKYFKYFST